MAIISFILWQLSEFNFEVLARDGGVEPQETTVPVKIKVVDLENKAPNWEEYPRAPVTISEMTPVGSTFLSLSARSGIEDNPVVFYSLIDGSSASTNKKNTFFLQQRQDGDKMWADIKVNKRLDYEKLKEYNLTIKVTNNGPQKLSKETIVTILLEDENDEIPLFEELEDITVLEGEPPGTRVTQIKATDKDGVYPNNAVRVTYRIVPSPNNDGDKYFHIDPRTGIITTRQIFDREEKQAYALQIEAIDGARSARPDVRGENRVTKFIRIGVADKNDNPPYFDKDVYEAEVDENEDKGHTVLTVIAHDKDESSRIRYEITKGNVAGAFGVKNMTGAIYVVGSLDFETRNRHIINKKRKALGVIASLKDLPLVTIKTAIRIYHMKIEPMMTYLVDVIAPNMTSAQMLEMDRVKAAFLKRALAVHRSSSSTLAHELCGVSTLCEDQYAKGIQFHRLAWEEYKEIREERGLVHCEQVPRFCLF
ncbi:unnamed protein product [Cyprideis torosa]|uniref:Uncharacterized protein n=1 Tax=Cyprideis torosa TaxID=163714 RepID=A0A7R8WNR9_9CRUS|nr:unnamed protein product [Cyprideis torosa]CAG0904326.1 unnamed protein product [Cyprideis torosa]